MNEINYEVVTIEDCIDMYEKKNMATVINAGEVIEFVEDGEE